MTPIFTQTLSDAKRLAGAGKPVITTYEELSTSQHGLSLVLRSDPSAVIVEDTPRMRYAEQFAENLQKPEKLPCDIPGRVFSMKRTPQFIFVWEKSRD